MEEILEGTQKAHAEKGWAGAEQGEREGAMDILELKAIKEQSARDRKWVEENENQPWIRRMDRSFLRYEVAKTALLGLLQSPPLAVDVGTIPQPLAKMAVSIADELLRELEK